jgi:hypothetical protein
MRVAAFALGMLLVITGLLFMVTALARYLDGASGTAGMFFFGLAIFVGGKLINHASEMTYLLRRFRVGLRWRGAR